MKMEILLEPTSNKLMVEHAEYDESNTYVLERFNTTAGNPVKKILLKLNLSDHRLFKDGGGVKEFQRSFRHSDTERLSRSDEVLKLKNFKKDATLKLFKSTNQIEFEVRKFELEMNENKERMPTKIELTLEQSQQGVSDDVLKVVMDPVMQCTTLPSHSSFSQKKLVSFVTEIHTLSIDISLRDLTMEILLEPTSNKLLVGDLRDSIRIELVITRTASTAAKPCQEDSYEFYLITGSIYTTPSVPFLLSMFPF
ncbi:hypothetical protein Tco_0994530 [Tanacetum coccineum]